ncbi:MAG TPA: DUF370 domain-containing protein [Thermotogota bacterium]|nr:DUF370 domain-containing protein [Thermotogota bacterium]HRW35661.1 DUF370 domain-containing protein [Thermotogota bacterium]
MNSGELIDIGFKTYIVKSRVQGIFSPSNSIIKKFKSVADKEQMILNLTYGAETKSFIMMDSGHVVMTVLSVEEFLQLYMQPN